MNEKRTTQDSDFDVTDKVRAKVNSLRRERAAKRKENRAFDYELLVHSEENHRIISNACGALLHEPTVQQTEELIEQFCGQVKKGGMKATWTRLPLKKRKLQLADPYLLSPSDDEWPCKFDCSAESSPVSDNLNEYFLASPSIGWRIAVQGCEDDLEIFATIGSLPYDANSKTARQVLRAPKEEQCKLLPRITVFISGPPYHQLYATNADGVQKWLYEWLSHWLGE